MGDRKRVILLVGQTGTGKSSLGNLLCSSLAFATSNTAASKTKDGKTHESFKYIVNDTMGLNDTAESQVVVRSKITDMIVKMKDGIDIFLLTIKMGRYTESEHVGFLYLFDAILGPSSYRHCILVVTHCEPKYVDSVNAEKEQMRWIAESKRNNLFANLFQKINSRILFVRNEPKVEHKEMEEFESTYRRWSLMSLEETVDQLDAGKPFMMEEAKEAQQEYVEKLQKAEEEKIAAEAKLLEDARKVGEAAALELHRIEMARIEREMRAAQEKHKADIDKMVEQKNQEIKEARKNRKQGGGIFEFVGRTVDRLLPFL